jgi:hypothetical protein
MTRSHACCIALWLLASSGCVDEDGRTCNDVDVEDTPRPDFPLRRQTAHLDIYTERFVCAGSAAAFEHHVEFLGEQLGLEPRSNIPVYLWEGRPELCAAKFGSCVLSGGVVMATPGNIHHELNHAVACELRTGTSAVFTEGLAVMFDPTATMGIFGDDDHLPDMLKDWDSRYYDNAGHFSRWLLERDGADTFAALYREAVGYESAIASLEDLYGSSLAELEAEYLASAPREWVPFRQCADIPHVDRSDDGVWRYSGFMDCEDESTMGPYERPLEASVAGVHVKAWDLMYQSFTFTVEEEVLLDYDLQGEIVRVDFERCGDAHPRGDEDQWGDHFSVAPKTPQGHVIFSFSPGTWRADVLSLHGPPSPVGVSFQPH